MADGSQIEAVGMGNVSIGNLQLSGVLHVPRAGGNLVSVARLIDSGYQVSFGTKISTITQDDLRVEGERDGNLYYLPKYKSDDKANLGLSTNKSTPQTIEIWHQRLGHRTLDNASIQYIQPRVSELAIVPSTKGKDENKLCETCAIGRQHKEPMTGTRTKANELLDVVHSDICGPMQVGFVTGPVSEEQGQSNLGYSD